MVLNGFVLVFMVQMQTNIGLLCGRSYQGCVFNGPRLGYYLETSTSLDILVRGLAVTLLAMFAFSDFIENNFLVDLPLDGASFTWFRDSKPKSMSHIDRTLVSADWEDHFGNVSQRVLHCVIYDHCLLWVETSGVGRGCCAFKIENMWLKVEGFVEKVQQWWNGYCFRGSPSFVLA